MLMDLQDSNQNVAVFSPLGKHLLLQQMLSETGQCGLELFPLKVIMPCGNEVEYDRETFPEYTVFCPCGDPEHKIVEYRMH